MFSYKDMLFFLWMFQRNGNDHCVKSQWHWTAMFVNVIHVQCTICLYTKMAINWSDCVYFDKLKYSGIIFNEMQEEYKAIQIARFQYKWKRGIQNCISLFTYKTSLKQKWQPFWWSQQVHLRPHFHINLLHISFRIILKY